MSMGRVISQWLVTTHGPPPDKVSPKAPPNLIKDRLQSKRTSPELPDVVTSPHFTVVANRKRKRMNRPGRNASMSKKVQRSSDAQRKLNRRRLNERRKQIRITDDEIEAVDSGFGLLN